MSSRVLRLFLPLLVLSLALPYRGLGSRSEHARDPLEPGFVLVLPMGWRLAPRCL